MIPYSELFYFYILILVSIPAVVLGLLQRTIKYYGLAATVFMLFIIFGSSVQQLFFLGFFIGFEFLLIRSYLFICRKPRYGFTILFGIIVNLFILMFLYYSKPNQQMVYFIVFFVAETILIAGYVLFGIRYRKTFLLFTTVLLAISPLVLAKFGDVLIHQKEIGFLGISYLTFKVVQMVIETHDGLIKKISVFEYLYFLLYFPTISSGPIDRSRRFMENISVAPARAEYIELLGDGLFNMFLGVGYKFVLSNLISKYWMAGIPTAHTLVNTINYMYAFSFYLFFDFAGYSLIAIGVSNIFGIRTPANFNKPFISSDIKDFWNRWHMSLSFWFRDFIYTRIVMSSLKNKSMRRQKYLASYAGYIITMGLMGIWHGTALYFILYGLYHGVLLVLTDLYQRKLPWYPKVKNNIVWKCMSVAITFNLICFGFLIFSGYLFTTQTK